MRDTMSDVPVACLTCMVSESALGDRVSVNPRTDISRSTQFLPPTSLLRRLLALVALANADGVPF